MCLQTQDTGFVLQCRVTDIVADVGRPVRLRFSNRQSGPREHTLPVMIDIPEALHALTKSQPCELHVLAHSTMETHLSQSVASLLEKTFACWSFNLALHANLRLYTPATSNNIGLQATVAFLYPTKGCFVPHCRTYRVSKPTNH